MSRAFQVDLSIFTKICLTNLQAKALITMPSQLQWPDSSVGRAKD